jgi:hypothetical protein
MLILHPDIVRFESHAWDDALLIAVDRIAKRLIEDHSDAGPFAAFVDVPEQSIQVRVQRALSATDTDDPALGDAGDLVFYLAPPAGDLNRKRITIHCAVTAIRIDLPSGTKPATKTITLTAFKDDGSDPMSMDTPSLAEA